MTGAVNGGTRSYSCRCPAGPYYDTQCLVIIFTPYKREASCSLPLTTLVLGFKATAVKTICCLCLNHIEKASGRLERYIAVISRLLARGLQA
jgi:hypothetical protein